MNIGKRIVARLEELNWERKDLLDRCPNLTPQALSNLIRRDSRRSEWDEVIAEALGVSVMWLVYGRSDTRRADKSQTLDSDESILLAGFRTASPDLRATMLMMAEKALVFRQSASG